MPHPTKRLMELEAALLVSTVLGGQPKSRDARGPGAADQIHDFDIRLSDGRVIGLEVTTAAQQETVETLAAFRHLVNAKFPSLTHNWSLTGRHPGGEAPAPRMRLVAREANDLLKRLEVAEVLEFDEAHHTAPPIVDPGARSAVDRLASLGIIAGRAMGVAPVGEAFVGVGLVGGGGTVDAEAINASVAREALANQEKLKRSGAEELHLFVWIDGSMFSEELAMHLGQVPALGPSLPKSINTVWAGTWGPGASFKSNTSRLWRSSPPGGWEILPVPELPTTGPFEP